MNGEPSYSSLQALPRPIDIVDVFRKPHALAEIVDEAIAVGARVLWAQLDVVSLDDKPEQKALVAGLKVVSNKCIRTEHERLFPQEFVAATDQD